MAICPECQATIAVEQEDVEEGKTVDCPECGAQLEVVNTNPVELDLVAKEDAEEEEEAW